MSALPDELWSRIMEIGIENPCSLNYKDLCRLAITCRRLNRLSNDDSLWSSLLSSDFPKYDKTQFSPLPSSSNTNNPSSSSSSKSLYKIRYERDKAQKVAAHRRAVLRVESRIAEHSRKLRELQHRSVEESAKMKSTAAEMSNLLKARQASAALNVWQPDVVRIRHRQMVEQSVVPAESRVHALQMELKLCKQQLMGLEKSCRDERRRLEAAKEQLASIKYHPLIDDNLGTGKVEEGIKRKKLKKDHSHGRFKFEISMNCMRDQPLD